MRVSIYKNYHTGREKMKILFVAPYVYDERYPEFTKNHTGFGIVVNDIFRTVSEKEDAYLITHVLTKGHGKILPHTFWDIFLHLRIADILQAFKWAARYNQNILGRLRYAYYCLNKGSFRYILKK